MALISKTTISEVNLRMDAISVIGDYVRLEKKSGRWWGRCPFHGGGQEKTPSFKVDPDLKMYHCFGCAKGGSAISFVMEMEKISYPEAIKSLAKKIGIEIIYEDGGEEYEKDNSIKEELFELYRRTNVTFSHFLNEKPEGKNALDYIEDRAFSKETIQKFQLGYAPSDRAFLHKFLKQKGYSDDFLEKSGLFSSNYKTVPLFSGRLMFPIMDRQGRIVAFGGRALPGILQSDGKEPPKYINSPETEIYKKGQTLFAIDLAKEEMRRSKTVYLAEGYMDVMAMHQAGVTNAVAPLGTAFTDEQAMWLRRWVDRAILYFDNDEAGRKAAYKAIVTCRKNGLSCDLVDPKEGQNDGNFKDPADILQKFGPEILNKKLKFVITDFEYLISYGGSAAAMFPFLDALDSEVEKADCITRIADIFKIERSAVQKDYLHRKPGKTYNERPDAPVVLQKGAKVTRNAELCLLTIVALNMELYEEFRAALEIGEIGDYAAKELFVALEECFMHEERGTDALLARIDNEALRKFIAESGTSGEFSRDAEKLMQDGLKGIKKKSLEKKLTGLNAQMREGERKKDGNVNIDDLLAEKMSIDMQIRKLKGR
ncbi:MAG: DNA primase [Treponema sp.]|nr:DNA primase [Treponema sp.]MCL2236632.1 DNA primase [Treponema sp.]